MNLLRKLLFVIALSPLSVHAGWFGNYDDCILENMKGIQSNSGAAAVKEACRSKYPLKKGYVPAKCKNIVDPNYSPSKNEGMTFKDLLPREFCIKECLNASYWSKHFGECKE